MIPVLYKNRGDSNRCQSDKYVIPKTGESEDNVTLFERSGERPAEFYGQMENSPDFLLYLASFNAF